MKLVTCNGAGNDVVVSGAVANCDLRVVSQVSQLLARHPQFGLENYSPAWFAVFTTSCHEKRVAEYFGQREIDSFLPLYRSTRRWKNRRTVHLELPLFPSYIFARVDRRERVRILEVPGVLGIVGNRREAAEISETYIESLREGLRLHKIEPHPYLVVGDRVRIINGPMTGLEGVLVRKKNDCRVVLTLELIMRSVAVEIDAADLELLRDHHHDGMASRIPTV
jgi:transcription antitermination factor NusG